MKSGGFDIHNLATAVAVVLAHRRMSRQLAGKEPILPLHLQLEERLGPACTTPMLDALG